MPEKFTGYKCECCGEYHEIDKFTPLPKPVAMELFRCDDCGYVHETEDEAKECCE